MNAQSPRKIEMGTRALDFSRAHPDTDAGYGVSAARLEQLVARAGQIAAAQRDGLIDSASASVRKRELRRVILAGPIAHLAEVGQLAARESHELAKTFRFKPGAETYLAFRTAARGMAAEAQTHREVLMKYGMSESVLEHFGGLLDQFDAALSLGNDGRTAHKGATQELAAVASEIARTVRVMDARNRQRYEEDGQLLGSWTSASTVLGTPQRTPGTGGSADDRAGPPETQGMTSADGDIRPAA